MPRKIDVGTAVSKVFAIYRAHAGPILTLSAIIVGVSGIVAALLTAASPVLGILGAIIGLIASAILTGMIVELARDVQDGTLDSSIGGLYETAKPYIVPLILAALLTGIGIAIGFVLLIIPGLILLTIWSVYAPAIVLEGKGVVDSLRRSRELVRGNGWQVFGIIVVFFLLFVVLGILVSAIGGAAGAVLRVIANIFTAPFVALASAVVYFELLGARDGGSAPAAATPGETPLPPPPPPQPPTDLGTGGPPAATA